MQAIGKYIVVVNITEEIRTEGGLLLSSQDSDEFRYKKAKVINPGSDVSVIKADDLVYYDKGHSFTMVINNKRWVNPIIC